MTRGSPKFSEKTQIDEENDEEESDLDYNDLHSTSMNAHLLFTKESISSSGKSGPLLFPNSSRNSFLIMTCKRTVFACRGLFLFCFLAFLVISVVASYSDKIGSEGGAIVGANNGNETENDSDSNHKLMSVPLPSNWAYGGNVSEVEVKFNMNCNYKKIDYAAMGNSLRKGIEFYEKNADSITVLDAALGTKIVSEQIKIIKELHPKLPNEITAFLNDVENRSKILTEEMVGTVKQTMNGTKDLEYTLPWLETKDLWNLPLNRRWYEVGQLSSYNPTDGESFEDVWEIASRNEAIDEFVSDACIYQVFHCRTINITQECQEAFLSTISSMYSLTHQVIYMLLTRKNDCLKESSWKQVPELEENGDIILEKMCGKVWQEANSIAESNFPSRFRDLLVEQIGMCSLAGYTEFLRRDWLRRLLYWQGRTSSGCFGERRRQTSPSMEMLLKTYQKLQNESQQGQFVDPYVIFNRQEHEGTRRRRYKRSDMFLEDSQDKCSVHFTSVGITAISIHLRYFFDTCLDSY